ncbi:MAG: iron-containing alcohol dehydrogenase, partial [Planctomycetota bacterium]|nr:iron-containing alcohol dehydrogenase [Planctomycetota bacterium]
AIPTTSGTGSEATHFAAIYVRGRKVSVSHPSMRPAATVMDASLHAKMPSRLAAVTGLDALCQSLESMWAVGSTDESLAYSRLGAALVAQSLVESVTTGAAASRAAMMWGTHAAGMAINISKTTAPHALSYQLTSRFGIEHGLAAALTLGHIGRANARVEEHDCGDPRGAAWVRSRVQEAAASLGATPDRLPSAVAVLLAQMHLPTCLREAGVDRQALSTLAAEVDPVRLGNNPRILSVNTLVAALESAWLGPDSAAGGGRHEATTRSVLECNPCVSSHRAPC